MNGISGQVAVVTGARGEIAGSVAHRLAALGATVWAVDVQYDGRATERHGRGGIVRCHLDVTDSAAVTSLFEEIVRDSGPPTLLVNGAGGPGRTRSPVDKVTDGDWHRIVSLNLDAVFYCSREAARWMKHADRSGSIVNISSGAGRTSSRTGVQAYAAAKAGTIGLTRQLARELGAHNIRVNCVAPGLIDVAGISEEIARISPTAMKAHLEGVALGRLGTAEDLSGPILFFLSDEAAYVTGQTISVDGGSTMLG